MTTLANEISRLIEHSSEKDVKIAIGELVKKLPRKPGASASIAIRDAEDKSMGFFIPFEAMDKPDPNDLQTLLAVARYRSENPPDHYLTPDEFIAEIMKDPS